MSNLTTEPVSTTSERLVGWGSYDTLRDSILPRVFGHLVRLSHEVVDMTTDGYPGDLYHDALSLRAVVEQGMNPDQTASVFDFTARRLGTFLGSMAVEGHRQDRDNSTLYRIVLHMTNDREWWLTTTRLRLVAVTD